MERLSCVPVRLQTQSRRIIPEFAIPVTPDPVDFRELSGSPKFPGNPHDHSPCSSTPAGPGTRYGTRGQRTRHGPRTKAKRGLLTVASFGAPSHGFWSRCLSLKIQGQFFDFFGECWRPLWTTRSLTIWILFRWSALLSTSTCLSSGSRVSQGRSGTEPIG